MRHDARWRDPRQGPHREPHHPEATTAMLHNHDVERPWYAHWQASPRDQRKSVLRAERSRAHQRHKYQFAPVAEHPPHKAFTFLFSVFILAAFFPTAFVAAATVPAGQPAEIRSGSDVARFGHAPLPDAASPVARDAAGDAAAFTQAGEPAYVVCHQAAQNLTLVVAASALSGHLAHGDAVGACIGSSAAGPGSGAGSSAPGGGAVDAGGGVQGAGSGPAPQGAGSGPAVQGASNGPTPSQEHKLEVCHVPPGNASASRTLLVAAAGWPAHEAHGDSLGACGGGDDGDGDWTRKVVVCHAPPGRPDYAHTLNISVAALDAHLGHGDSLGACGDGPADDTVTVCHVPPGNAAAAHTLNVSASALAAHLGHGDTLGACAGPGSGLALVIEDGEGAEIGDLSIRAGRSQHMVAVLYDNGTLVGAVNATWNTTGDLDPVAAGPSADVTFTAQTVGTSGTVTATYNPTDATGTITVVAGGGGGGGGGSLGSQGGDDGDDAPADEDGPPGPPGPGGAGGGGPGGFPGSGQDEGEGSSVYAPHDFAPEAAVRGFHKAKNFDAEEHVGVPGHAHAHFDAHEFGTQ